MEGQAAQEQTLRNNAHIDQQDVSPLSIMCRGGTKEETVRQIFCECSKLAQIELSSDMTEK